MASESASGVLEPWARINCPVSHDDLGRLMETLREIKATFIITFIVFILPLLFLAWGYKEYRLFASECRAWLTNDARQRLTKIPNNVELVLTLFNKLCRFAFSPSFTIFYTELRQCLYGLRHGVLSRSYMQERHEVRAALQGMHLRFFAWVWKTGLSPARPTSTYGALVSKPPAPLHRQVFSRLSPKR